MTRVKAIPILQAAKVFGLTGFMLGGVSSCLGLILILIFSTESPVVTLSILISLPLVGAFAGFAGTAATCWLYNANARWSGGLRLDLEEETVAARSPGDDSEIVGPPASGQHEQEKFDRQRQMELLPVKFYRLKLGPAGADRSQYGIPPSRKQGDWVDVRNEGAASVRTNGLCLYHLEYPSPGGAPEYRFVVTLPECSLKPGEVLRLHCGPRRDVSALYVEDRSGADWHAFTGGEACLWNRLEGDTAVLYEVAKKETIDSVSYDPDPPEGIVLQRQGSKFATAPVGAAAGSR